MNLAFLQDQLWVLELFQFDTEQVVFEYMVEQKLEIGQ